MSKYPKCRGKRLGWNRFRHPTEFDVISISAHVAGIARGVILPGMSASESAASGGYHILDSHSQGWDAYWSHWEHLVTPVLSRCLVVKCRLPPTVKSQALLSPCRGPEPDIHDLLSVNRGETMTPHSAGFAGLLLGQVRGEC